MFTFLKSLTTHEDTVADTPIERPVKRKPRKASAPKKHTPIARVEIDAVLLMRNQATPVPFKKIAKYIGRTPAATSRIYYDHKDEAPHLPAITEGKPVKSEKVAQREQTHHQRILAAIGSGAKTQQDISTATLIHITDVAKSLAVLERSGKVRRCGYEHGPTGRPRRAYALANGDAR